MASPPTTSAEPSTSVSPSVRVAPLPARPGRVRQFFSFVWWLITGMGLLSHLFRRGTARVKSDEVIVYSVPRSFYLWALLLAGFVGAAMVKHRPAEEGVWGWIYLAVMLFTFLSLLFDVGLLRFLLWGMIIAFVWLIARYLQDLKQIPILTRLVQHFHNLDPKLNPGFATVLSWALLIPWIGSLFYTFTRGCKHFSPNGIEEWHFEGREVMDRSGLKFRSHYRDVFETVLGLGAGDLEAIDADQHVVKRWENVLFLAFIWPRLDLVLHQRSATVDNAPDEPVEVEEVNKK